MNKDTWVGIAGAVILIAAMVGVFTYERSNATALATSPTDAESASVIGPTTTGTVQLGKADTKILNVTHTSASNVTFHITWKATNGKDTLKVTVAPPAGSGIMEGAQATADSGNITLSVPVPSGASPAGGWEVKVEFTAATPAALPGGVPPPTPPPGSTDGSVSYTIATSVD